MVGNNEGRRCWMTAEEAARYLGLPSRKALYQAVRRGQIPGHRMGRRLRFDGGELGQLLKHLAEKPSEKPDSQQQVIAFLGEVFKAEE